MFGSVISDNERSKGCTYGRADQGNGVVYRWVFSDGKFDVRIYQDHYLVKATA